MGARAPERREGSYVGGADGYCSLSEVVVSQAVATQVDLLTLKDPGGWKTLSMVTRYTHLIRAGTATSTSLPALSPAVT